MPIIIFIFTASIPSLQLNHHQQAQTQP